ncbi:MAG: thiolase family protein [Bacillota bacterium]|nr:MAG: acetyl-CoA C-acetyltransferase [Bacillota bacterium]
MRAETEVVIAAGARSPIGSFGGSLSRVPLVEFTAVVMAEAMRRAGVRGDEVDEVIMGQVYQAGFRANPARQAALRAGVAVRAPACMVNQQCSSGSRAVEMGADQIRLGRARIVLAGGMEAMSQVPFLSLRHRSGQRLGHDELKDGLLWDALVDPFLDQHMGVTAENVAREYGIDRAAADAYALRSQQRAAAAVAAGRFREEIVPIPVPGPRRGETVLFEADEHPRPETSLEALAGLKPAFLDGGICTAGNSSGINDGAAVLVLMSRAEAEARGIRPLARLVHSVSVAVEPRVMGIGPVPAIRRLLEETGLRRDEIDLWEINEAFAVQVLACIRELGLDEERVNVNGGAIALGHPVGATGARLILTLAYELRRRGLRWGVASQCAGGGPAMATLIEVV